VGGTLKNLSFRGNPPPPLGGGLHGFTIQIPFSMSQGSLNCDAGQSYAVQLGGSGTCSVSNNVLTVTQNFPSSWYWYWTPGRSSGGVTYASVGSSLPPGVDCCAYVTWGTPTVTAVH
jgi:hypothetical protein